MSKEPNSAILSQQPSSLSGCWITSSMCKYLFILKSRLKTFYVYLKQKLLIL